MSNTERRPRARQTKNDSLGKTLLEPGRPLGDARGPCAASLGCLPGHRSHLQLIPLNSIPHSPWPGGMREAIKSAATIGEQRAKFQSASKISSFPPARMFRQLTVVRSTVCLHPIYFTLDGASEVLRIQIQDTSGTRSSTNIQDTLSGSSEFKLWTPPGSDPPACMQITLSGCSDCNLHSLECQ